MLRHITAKMLEEAADVQVLAEDVLTVDAAVEILLRHVEEALRAEYPANLVRMLQGRIDVEDAKIYHQGTLYYAVAREVKK